eukprot:XP_011407484.1 PREDICTED: uncharacterized protein LOC105314803 [Amphimedon queenslandica]
MKSHGQGGGGCRLAVDIGGTFTDVVLEHSGGSATAKVLTTHSAPDDGVMVGVDEVLERSGYAPGDISLLIHGTTLATNAIIERKGAKTAFLTTSGFRDVLDIGYESRHDQYDLMLEKPPALVPREMRFTVSERIDVRGRVIEALDEAAVAALARRLAALEVESVGIGFLHSYVNPAHERRAREIIARCLPGVSVTLSCEVCPEVREYERFCTTVANAYIQPLMAGYLERLGRKSIERGLSCPLLLMTSGGGLTALDSALRFPIRLVESGPAGGAILAAGIARELGLEKALSFDMGGTTAKICLIDDFVPGAAREFEVDRRSRFMKGSGLPLRIPVIEMVEIGAGGGSIAAVDRMGRIAVGPESAGSEPGPAAYGRGGAAPTVTDADILLGRIDPSRFAGGSIPLDVAAAQRAVADAIGAPLGLEEKMAAFGIAEMVDETMANAARVHAVEQGKNAAEHAIIAFGEAAPLHAGRLVDKLGIETLVIPAQAGVGSAVGFLRAAIAYEVVRSRNMRLRDFDPRLVDALLEEMAEEALAVVRRAAPEAGIRQSRGAFMRYVGQGHEIYVPLPLRGIEAEDRSSMSAAFDRAYRRLYRRTLLEAEIEVLTFAVTVSTVSGLSDSSSDSASQGADVEPDFDASGRLEKRAGIEGDDPGLPPCNPPPPLDHLEAPDLESGRTLQVPLWRREDLAPGAVLDGPAIVCEDETSTFVAAHFRLQVTAHRHLLIRRMQ